MSELRACPICGQMLTPYASGVGHYHQGASIMEMEPSCPLVGRTIANPETGFSQFITPEAWNHRPGEDKLKEALKVAREVVEIVRRQECGCKGKDLDCNYRKACAALKAIDEALEPK